MSSGQGFFGLQVHPNGAVTPIDEPAVAAAKADHLSNKFGHLGYSNFAVGYGQLNVNAHLVAHPNGAVDELAAPVASSATAYAGPLNLNTHLVAHPNGAVVPINEPAVAAARADHLALHGVPSVIAPAPVTSIAPVQVAAGYTGPLNLNNQLVAHPNGAVVPLDEPAVAAARADHLASKGAIYASAAPIVAAAPAHAVAAAPIAVGYAGYAGPLNVNTQLVAHPNGAVVPIDEPAVAAARADHLAAKGVYGGVYAAAGPVAYAAGYAPYAGLVAHPNGAVVPIDEPAVAAARANHLAAHGI